MAQGSLLFLLSLVVLTASTTATQTIQEVLNSYGFPLGIVPDSVTSYSTTQEEKGISFVIQLKKPCEVKMPYLVHYFDQEISGKASYRQITDLTGLKLKWLFWLESPYDVVKIKVTGALNKYPRLVYSVDTVTDGFIDVEANSTPYWEIPTCKDKALAACDDRSSRLISQLPVTAESLKHDQMKMDV